MSPKRVDTHFHFVPESFAQAIAAAGSNPSGPWDLPKWTPESAIAAMDTLGTAKGILSVTTPGPAIAGNGAAGRTLTREVNKEALAVVQNNPQRFGWFASLPDWTDVQGTLDEIEWAFKVAKADGVVIMAAYNNLLLGHDSFKPIWDKLDELKAVVFIHPTSIDISPKYIAGNVSQAVVDFTFGTTRAAVDLVLTKTLATHANVKIILSHAGGTLPFLAERLSILPKSHGMSREEVKRDMARFWVDVALSTSKGQLQGILAFTTPDKVLYGSDFPYCSLEQAKHFTDLLDTFVAKDAEGKSLENLAENARALFGW